jgi:hypothetical protein
MGITNNATDVPNIAFEYWGITDFMRNHPGLYGLDKRRAECHSRLCSYYGISRDESSQVTGYMDRYADAIEFHEALCNLKRDAAYK